MERTALKAAKKMVRKSGSYTLKGKALMKKIAKKIGEECTLDDIKQWLATSGHFAFDGKLVIFKSSGTDALNSASKVAPNTTMDRDLAKTWRQDHKIVVKGTSSSPNEDESALDAILNDSEAYFPYTSFDSLRRSGEVSDLLLRQCTDINSFVQPSPIQAQCWPVLLHTGTDGKQRDVIGIAETGR